MMSEAISVRYGHGLKTISYYYIAPFYFRNEYHAYGINNGFSEISSIFAHSPSGIVASSGVPSPKELIQVRERLHFTEKLVKYN